MESLNDKGGALANSVKALPDGTKLRKTNTITSEFVHDHHKTEVTHTQYKLKLILFKHKTNLIF